MIKAITSFLLISTLLLTLTGCGDLFGKKKQENSLKPVRPGNDCELDIDAFTKILEENVGAAISCLGTKLESFMDYEEMGGGDSLSRQALINFLMATRPDIKPHTYKVINTVFALNHLITGEKADFITRKNVQKIVKLGLVFNRQAWMNFSRFRSKVPVKLDVHQLDRKRVQQASWEIQSEIAGIYKPWREGKVHSLNIVTIIESFLREGDTETLDKIKGLLFAKKILFGGEKEVLTHVELGRLFSSLPRIITVLLDSVRLKYITLDQHDAIKLAQDDAFSISEIIFHNSLGNRSKEVLFQVDEAIEGVQGLLKDTNLTKYRALFHEGMRILTQKAPDALDGEEDKYFGDYKITGGDVEKIFNHIFNVTGKGLAFHKMYDSDHLRKHMLSPQSLNLDPKQFEQFFPGQKSELQDFIRIANRYRFQKGSRPVASYSTEFVRNAEAFFETAAYEYAIRLAFRFYGSSLSMSKEQILALLKKFENELIETEIMLPRRASNTAETIALLGSLFQYQSDNNKVLDVNEGTEFAISLITAMQAKSKMFGFLEKQGCEKDEFNRLDPLCFRRNFLKGLCTNYRPHFPRLFKYLGIGSLGCATNFLNEHNNAYLDSSIKAARFCNVYSNGEEIHYSEGDIMSILLAMMHIETTIIRWDTNLNNTMDFEEVMKAYEIYEPAIQGMLPKLPDIINKPDIVKALAKVVYKYLVKYEQTPQLKGPDLLNTILRLLKFDLKAPAHRKTIASILWIVSEEGKKKSIEAGEPQFDCNWLRDPDNIPRD